MDEPVQIGLSRDAHDKLRRLKEDDHFNDMMDGYRFAIALAIARGVSPEDKPEGRGGPTMFTVGGVDPTKAIYVVIKSLLNPTEPVYKVAEKLAEWGVHELSRMSDSGGIPVADLIEEAERLATLRDPR